MILGGFDVSRSDPNTFVTTSDCVEAKALLLVFSFKVYTGAKFIFKSFLNLHAVDSNSGDIRANRSSKRVWLNSPLYV